MIFLIVLPLNYAACEMCTLLNLKRADFNSDYMFGAANESTKTVIGRRLIAKEPCIYVQHGMV